MGRVVSTHEECSLQVASNKVRITDLFTVCIWNVLWMVNMLEYIEGLYSEYFHQNSYSARLAEWLAQTACVLPLVQ